MSSLTDTMDNSGGPMAEEGEEDVRLKKTATKRRSFNVELHHVMTLSTIACCSLAVRRK